MQPNVKHKTRRKRKTKNYDITARKKEENQGILSDKDCRLLTEKIGRADMWQEYVERLYSEDTLLENVL